MPRIEFPGRLAELLEGSELLAPLRDLADRVGTIVADNKTHFFPDYTDHGIEHIERVLRSEVDLVPVDVWADSKPGSDPRLLCDADAAVIIGATFLHDIAMHLWPAGFLELVAADTRFQPLDWFKEDHQGHSADRPWPDLWDDYVREARRFSDRDLTNIIGEKAAREWKFTGLPEDTGSWERNHFLIIGEFIRRHHARLAHEIAIHGFPGLPVGSGEREFPAMGESDSSHVMHNLADLIGIAARSHGTSLRVCKAYLDSHPLHNGALRPMGTAVLYPMALLRVADYLQIDRQRAPAILLQLREAQSPISIQEWQKHLAVLHIGPAEASRATNITVSDKITLPLYLQLRDLLTGLQSEMDHSTAVLDEAYGAREKSGLDRLNLAIRRVYSNLNTPEFRNSLPYVPEETGFSADPHLLTLLVEPLYGKEPSVGVREIMQNAVDAVRELNAWCTSRGIARDSLDLPAQDCDVLIEYVEQESGSWILRCRDKGIGMSSDTIRDYLLRAGASFRRSPEWLKEFTDDKGMACLPRSGRFGIGVFATFLLGNSFRISTRFAGSDDSTGILVEAFANSRLVTLQRVQNTQVGTVIEVDLSEGAVADLGITNEGTPFEEDSRFVPDWYCWDWPTVAQRILALSDEPCEFEQRSEVPVSDPSRHPEWSAISPDGYDAVYWTFSLPAGLSCNGIDIRPPVEYGEYGEYEGFAWSLHSRLNAPYVAVVDSQAELPLTIQRYELVNEDLPFAEELDRDVTLSFIAHSLICGPRTPLEAIVQIRPHPLLQRRDRQLVHFHGFLHLPEMQWCVTSEGMYPRDQWLYHVLGTHACLVYGTAEFKRGSYRHEETSAADETTTHEAMLAASARTNCAVTSESVLAWERIGEPESGFSDGGLASYLIHSAESGLAPFCRRARVTLLLSSKCKDLALYSHVPDWTFRAVHPEAELSVVNSRVSDGPPWRLLACHPGDSEPSDSLASAMEAMEGSTDHERCFVIEAYSGRVDHGPETVLAKAWDECFGPRAIPFESKARADMIEQGSQHPDLRRHIEAWQAMKRAGSEWATGEYC